MHILIVFTSRLASDSIRRTRKLRCGLHVYTWPISVTKQNPRSDIIVIADSVIMIVITIASAQAYAVLEIINVL